MKDFIIDYDLNTEGQKYSELILAIKELNYHELCKSSWVIKSDLTCSEIRDKLKQYIDNNDKLFVAEIKDWASRGIKETSNWLNNKT